MTTGLEFPELASFDETLRYFMEPRGIPAGSLAVTRNGKLVLARGYTDESVSGFEDDLVTEPTSLFRIASVSKPITAVAVLALVEDGELELSAKLTELLPLTAPPGQRPDPRLQDVTVLNLLQHLGGFEHGWDYDHRVFDALGVPLPISLADLVTFMTGQPLLYTPGTTHSYSNYGYLLLGLLIEQVTGMPYEEYVKNRVWRALDVTRPVLGRTLEEHRLPGEVKYHDPGSGPTVMDSTRAIVPCPYGTFNLEHHFSGGGWLSSAVDLVRFASAFDEPAASPILSPVSIEVMFGLPENIDAAAYTLGDHYYACGWNARAFNTSRSTWHDGGLCGTRTLLVRRFDGFNWAVLFNRREHASGLSYSEIDRLLHVAADSVGRWPDHDLFDRYLDLT